MLARSSGRSTKMRYAAIFDLIRVSLIRGYAFFGLAVVCFLVLTVLVILYGDIKMYKVNPDNPNIMSGPRRDMDKDTFDRYYSILKTTAGICFLSMAIGMTMYGLWKRQST
jgi:hypothetical protein